MNFSRDRWTWCAVWIGAMLAGRICEMQSLVAEEIKPADMAIPETVTPVSVEKPKLPSPPKEIEESMLRLHNDARSRRGLAPLKTSPQLNAAAQRFADYMQRSGRFSHYADGHSPDQRIQAEGYGTASWAENIAMSQPTPEAAMSTWMNSSGHRGNILSGHSQVGFGRAGNIWVTVFANPARN